MVANSTMTKGEKLVQVYWTSNEIEAQFIKGLLEDNDIPCLVRSANLVSSMYPSNVIGAGVGPFKIEVLESMAEEAKKLIGGT